MSGIILRAVVGAENAGRKLKYFARGDMGVSYTRFNSLKYKNGLRVNGCVVHANYLLKEGDEVEIEIFETSEALAPAIDLPVNIAYEDEDLIIIDKSAPLPCQHSPRQGGDSLESRLAAMYGDGFVFRPVNRLDKGTSGLMCASKNAHAYQLLQKTLHTGAFLREYLAVVCGFLEGEGVIDAPIAKADAASVRRVVDVERGKPSVTHYAALERRGAFTLVRLRLETGRTHQIRAHMAYIGHPVAGDFLYGTELDALPGRFALHSARIALDHPLTGARVELVSPLPDALEALR